MPLSGRLRNRAARAALKDVSHQNSLRKAIAIATMNALSEYIRELQPERRKRIEYGVDAFDVLTLANYKKTVVVGALVPLLKRLINEERSFHVLEQDVRTLKGKELEHYVPASEFLRVVPAADLLVITGVTMLNDTLPELLDQAKSGAEVLVTGRRSVCCPMAYLLVVSPLSEVFRSLMRTRCSTSLAKAVPVITSLVNRFGA